MAQKIAHIWIQKVTAAQAASIVAGAKAMDSHDGAQRCYDPLHLVQVENESGSVGSIRDFTPAAQKCFDADVPPAFARSLDLRSGNRIKAFGPVADESFAAYSTAHYIHEVATAGKAGIRSRYTAVSSLLTEVEGFSDALKSRISI